MEDLQKIEAPVGGLVLSPLNTKEESTKQFNEWLESSAVVSREFSNEEKITNHHIVKEFIGIVGDKGISSTFCLIGGAVVDIIEGRQPKDYDFMGATDSIKNKFEGAGYKFLYNTRTSDTYYKNGVTVQFLKTSVEDFDFEIGRSSFFFKGLALKVDKNSFDNKLLVPINFEKRRNVLNSLKRVPHWKKKGYSIDDTTYLSLLNNLGGESINLNS